MLSAVESSVINDTMIRIPVLAGLFLGETITTKELLKLIVQLQKSQKNEAA